MCHGLYRHREGKRPVMTTAERSTEPSRTQKYHVVGPDFVSERIEVMLNESQVESDGAHTYAHLPIWNIRVKINSEQDENNRWLPWKHGKKKTSWNICVPHTPNRLRPPQQIAVAVYCQAKTSRLGLWCACSDVCRTLKWVVLPKLTCILLSNGATPNFEEKGFTVWGSFWLEIFV